MSKLGVQQSTLCYHLNQYKNNKCNEEAHKGIHQINILILIILYDFICLCKMHPSSEDENEKSGHLKFPSNILF